MQQYESVRRQNDQLEAAVIVAHPDDEALWCGGLLLSHPKWNWYIVTLCRASDPDRAPKFHRVLSHLNATGDMADLDDRSDQLPLAPELVRDTLVKLLPARRFHRVLTHGPQGEYTRHRRHEECCRAVVSLWSAGRLQTDQLWLFAYEDGDGAYLPRPDVNAHHRFAVPESTWLEKRRIITDVYGFAADSWEARTTPRQEAFWRFPSPQRATDWIAETEQTP